MSAVRRAAPDGNNYNSPLVAMYDIRLPLWLSTVVMVFVALGGGGGGMVRGELSAVEKSLQFEAAFQGKSFHQVSLIPNREIDYRTNELLNHLHHNHQKQQKHPHRRGVWVARGRGEDVGTFNNRTGDFVSAVNRS